MTSARGVVECIEIRSSEFCQKFADMGWWLAVTPYFEPKLSPTGLEPTRGQFENILGGLPGGVEGATLYQGVVEGATIYQARVGTQAPNKMLIAQTL